MHALISYIEVVVAKMREVERVVQSCGVKLHDEKAFLGRAFSVTSTVPGNPFSIQWSLEIDSVEEEDDKEEGESEDEFDWNAPWGNVCIPKLEFELWYRDSEVFLRVEYDPQENEWTYTDDSADIFAGHALEASFTGLAKLHGEDILSEEEALDFISMITTWCSKQNVSPPRK